MGDYWLNLIIIKSLRIIQSAPHNSKWKANNGILFLVLIYERRPTRLMLQMFIFYLPSLHSSLFEYSWYQNYGNCVSSNKNVRELSQLCIPFNQYYQQIRKEENIKMKMATKKRQKLLSINQNSENPIFIWICRIRNQKSSKSTNILLPSFRNKNKVNSNARHAWAKAIHIVELDVRAWSERNSSILVLFSRSIRLGSISNRM